MHTFTTVQVFSWFPTSHALQYVHVCQSVVKAGNSYFSLTIQFDKLTDRYTRISVNQNSLGCVKPSAMDVNQWSCNLHVYVTGIYARMYVYVKTLQVLSWCPIYTYTYIATCQSVVKAGKFFD